MKTTFGCILGAIFLFASAAGAADWEELRKEHPTVFAHLTPHGGRCLVELYHVRHEPEPGRSLAIHISHLGTSVRAYWSPIYRGWAFFSSTTSIGGEPTLEACADAVGGLGDQLDREITGYEGDGRLSFLISFGHSAPSETLSGAFQAVSTFEERFAPQRR